MIINLFEETAKAFTDILILRGSYNPGGGLYAQKRF
jgi:hypothetical protein